jgi:hypothetical protein
VSRRAALLLLVLAIAGLVLATRREAAAPAAAPAAGVTRARPELPRDELAVDPATIRDVFHFVDRPSAAVRPQGRGPVPALTRPAPLLEAFRLVGLVRRQGRLLAAFAVDGDVVLAGPGETAGGVTVVDVGEDGVSIRRPDGAVERLVLP